MNKVQLSVLTFAFLLFAIMYFGLDVKPKNQKLIEHSRTLEAESTNINILLKDAQSNLDDKARNKLLSLETLLNQSESDSSRIEVTKKIAGAWFEFNHPEISGYYAEQIAEQSNSEDAWSIAGTTYTLCIQKSKDEKIKSYCAGRAVTALENAISINPENVDHKMNLALCYTDYPPKNNPMKGVLMLKDLNETHPDNVSVIVNLAQLALRTGQNKKAIERLGQAEKLDPDNKSVQCLLADAYRKDGAQSEAERYLALCKSRKN